jgi:hypothetical protein
LNDTPELGLFHFCALGEKVIPPTEHSAVQTPHRTQSFRSMTGPSGVTAIAVLGQVAAQPVHA